MKIQTTRLHQSSVCSFCTMQPFNTQNYIKTSSEITSDSAIEIQNIIQQQSSAFDQIVTTIRQISAGIENFSASTNTVNTATARLKSAADRLENLNKEIVAKEYK